MSAEPISYPRATPELTLVPGASSRVEPQEFRTAAIGAVVGFVSVTSAIVIAALVAGLGPGVALGMGLWIGFWGGAGFGFMLGGAVPGKHAARR
jgi:hypothetical protein